MINNNAKKRDAVMLEGDVRIISASSVEQPTVTISNSSSRCDAKDQRCKIVCDN